jgi:hypothetical protein
MAKGAALVLIPRFSILSGSGDSPTTFTTPPRDVSSFASASFQLVRGPIMTSNPVRARCTVTLEESPDKSTWVNCSAQHELPNPNGEALDSIDLPFRFRWLRARVELEGESVSCWLEGETRPRASGDRS